MTHRIKVNGKSKPTIEKIKSGKIYKLTKGRLQFKGKSEKGCNLYKFVGKDVAEKLINDKTIDVTWAKD